MWRSKYVVSRERRSAKVELPSTPLKQISQLYPKPCPASLTPTTMLGHAYGITWVCWEFSINLIKYQMIIKIHYVRLSRGFKEYLNSYSLINTVESDSDHDNWFNDLPQPNHIFSYGIFVFSSDGEKKNCLLIWYIGDHNHALCFKPIRVPIIL